MNAGRTSTLAGSAIIAVMALSAALVPLFGLPSPYELNIAETLAPPNGARLFGTDELGRDVFSRIAHATWTSLTVAVIATAIGLFCGTTIGVAAACADSWVDMALMRTMDLLLSFPAILLAIVIMASLGTSIEASMVAIGIVFIPGFARLTRASTLAVLRQPYVAAAQALGVSRPGIVLRHVLPNIAGPLIAETAAAFSYGVIFEAGLSFLGLGVQPPEPSWGTMLYNGRGFMAQAPWLVLAPALAIFLTALGFNLLGDGLRDLNDHRLR